MAAQNVALAVWIKDHVRQATVGPLRAGAEAAAPEAFSATFGYANRRSGFNPLNWHQRNQRFSNALGPFLCRIMLQYVFVRFQ